MLGAGTRLAPRVCGGDAMTLDEWWAMVGRMEDSGVRMQPDELAASCINSCGVEAAREFSEAILESVREQVQWN